ncbi:hypothetical protein BCR44DRAFT_35902 [Catenaria anguillulae PL171]|uniref:RanBP2-type domain-containing protein n=1 Tax=Catenaria anguillulae PL171 TaxID=765915 RepID=A0A1Y2HEY1_9FUNG|nr:hypothetical protein BCR44DRAFT_35902 [Catenaria anguillulae PL171]
MRAATVLGKQVVLVFIEMPLSATAQEQEQEQDEHEWACCSSDCTSAHNHHHHHNVTVKNDPGLVTADTQPQPPIAELTDTLFQSLKLSPSPIAQTLKHAHSTGSLALLTGDWICPSCSVVNYAFRDTCFKCDHDALDAHVPGRRLVVLPRQMMLTSSNTLNSKSVLRALAKLQGLWQGSLAKGKSTVGPLWACTNCLYVNRWGAHVCRKCGHDRDGWSRTVYRTAVGGEQQQVAPVPVEGYVWVDRGRAEQVLLPEQEQQHEEEEAYGEDEGQELVPKVDLTGRDKARDKAAVAKANRGWKRREEGAAQRDGDQDEWECD